MLVCATRPEKPPPFYKDDPVLWFSIVENALAYAGITRDQTKFQYIVSHAESTIIPLIADLIKNPPPTGKYDAIKNRIVTAFAEPTTNRLDRLFKGITIADKKPSHYLQELRELAGGHCDNEALKTLLLGQLGQSTRVALLASGEEDLEKLAVLADKIQVSQTNLISATCQESYLYPQSLVEDVAALVKRVDELCAMSNSTNYNHKTCKRYQPNFQPSKYTRKQGLCWYHEKFGARAKQCSQPCSWALNNRSEN